MSDVIRTDYTHQLVDAKKRLDKFLRIVVREDAMRIIDEMKNILLEKTRWTSIGDKQAELLKILENVPEYMDKYYIEKPDGTRAPRELIRSFRYEGENKERIDKAIKAYSYYANKLNSIVEINKDIDVLFLEKLNAIFSEYKSSTEYITRLVKRLLRYNVESDDTFNEADTTRVLILKQFIKQFGWFEDIKEFDVKDVQTLVKEKYDGKYKLIDDDIFVNCINQNALWYERQITEGFIDSIAKMQGIVKYKAPFIKMDSDVCEMIKFIINKDKLIEEAKLKEAKFLSECFEDSHYNIDLEWFKKPEDVGVNNEFCDVLCRVVESERLTSEAMDGKAKTIKKCFKDGILPSGDESFKSFDEIEITSEMCKYFYKILRKGTNEEDKRSKAAKNGTAKTLAECFAVYEPDMRITSINSIVMYFYKRIYDELDKRVENCTVKPSTYNDATKKGGDLYEKNRKKMGFYNFELLEIVDELSKARFSSRGKTREYLYVFAIAFDIRMIENGHPERITDIEKNLFWDYYADNIVNNLPKVAGFGDSSDVFIDGYGINYKNFAEVIFLWSLEQKNMTPAGRLKKAYEIIEDCKNKGKTEAEFLDDNSKAFDKKTEIYKDEFSIIKGLPEEKLKEYIIKKYPCKSNDSGIMQICSEHRTAEEIIQEQEKKVNNLLKKVEEDLLSDVTEEDLLWRFSEDSILADFFNEYEYLTNNRCKNCPKKSKSVFPYCKKYFDEFSCEEKDESEIRGKKTVILKNCGGFYVRYLDNHCKKVQELLEHNVHLKVKSFKPVEEHFKKSFSKVNELCNDNQESLKLLLNRIKDRLQADTTGEIHFKNVSRTTMIALCFYEFVLINWVRRLANDTIIGAFEKVYDSFCKGTVFAIKSFDVEGKKREDFEIIEYEGANSRLVRAGYQPIDPKNIFDIYLIYIAYRDNFLPIYSSQDDALIDLYSEYKNIFDELDKSRGDRIIDKDSISKDR